MSNTGSWYPEEGGGGESHSLYKEVLQIRRAKVVSQLVLETDKVADHCASLVDDQRRYAALTLKHDVTVTSPHRR